MYVKIIRMKRRGRAAFEAKKNFTLPLKFDRDQVQTELFDSKTVTQEEIAAWMRAVPQIDPDSPRAAQYIKTYDVAGKVAKAKADGTFWATIAAACHYIE